MRPGTTVTMEVTLARPGRRRYETFENNRNTPLPTYNRRGVVRWMDWKTKTATVKWADSTTSKVNVNRLTKEDTTSC